MIRISKCDSKFRRSYQPQIQEEVFLIHSVDERHKIPLYEIKALGTNEIVDGKFMNYELVSVHPQTKFSFKKVIKRNNRQNSVLISFHGLPDHFNEWIKNDVLLRIRQNGNRPVFQPLLKYLDQ